MASKETIIWLKEDYTLSRSDNKFIKKDFSFKKKKKRYLFFEDDARRREEKFKNFHRIFKR